MNKPDTPLDPKGPRMLLARSLDFIWPMGPIFALGIAVGFWGSDRGLRWVPDVAQWLLGVWALTVLAAFTSLRIARKHLTETPRGFKLRRTILALLVLFLLR